MQRRIGRSRASAGSSMCAATRSSSISGGRRPRSPDLVNRTSYAFTQSLGNFLVDQGANGILVRSARCSGHQRRDLPAGAALERAGQDVPHLPLQSGPGFLQRRARAGRGVAADRAELALLTHELQPPEARELLTRHSCGAHGSGSAGPRDPGPVSLRRGWKTVLCRSRFA